MSIEYLNDTMNIDSELDDDLESDICYSDFLEDIKRTSTPIQDDDGTQNGNSGLGKIEVNAQDNHSDGLYNTCSSDRNEEQLARSNTSLGELSKVLNEFNVNRSEMPNASIKRKLSINTSFTDEKLTKMMRSDMYKELMNSTSNSFKHLYKSCFANCGSETEQRIFELRRLLFPCINHFLHSCSRDDRCRFSHRFINQSELQEMFKTTDASEIMTTLYEYNQFFMAFIKKLVHFMQTSYTTAPTKDLQCWIDFSGQLSVKIGEIRYLLELQQ